MHVYIKRKGENNNNYNMQEYHQTRKKFNQCSCRNNSSLTVKVMSEIRSTESIYCGKKIKIRKVYAWVATKSTL